MTSRPRGSLRSRAIDSLPCMARTMLLCPSAATGVAAAASEQPVGVAATGSILMTRAPSSARSAVANGVA